MTTVLPNEAMLTDTLAMVAGKIITSAAMPAEFEKDNQ